MILFTTGLFVVLPGLSSAVPYDPVPSRSKFGVKGGAILPADIRIRENGIRNDLETDIGLAGGIFLDIPLRSRMFFGVSVDLYDIQVKNFVKRRKFFDFSMTLKRRFRLPDRTTELRAGVAAGVGHIARLGFVDLPTTYLTIKGTFEAAFRQSRRFAWLFELSIISVPTGGNGRFDISAGPTLLARSGVSF